MNTPRLQSFRLLAIALLCVVGSARAGTPGLLGEYFNQLNFINNPVGGQVLREDDMFRDNADFVSTELPAAFNAAVTDQQVRRENLSIRWTGDIRIDDPGLYTFLMSSDDGNQLFVSGQLIVGEPLAVPAAPAANPNAWRGQGIGQEYAGTINLAAGQHAIRINFQQGTGGIGIRIRWTKPDGTTEVVPADRFTPASRTVTANGVLSGSSAATVSPVNLSTEGTLDWIHFGNTGAFVSNRKTPLAAPPICNKAALAVSPDGFAAVATSAITYTWTGGTPTATGSTTSGIGQDRDLAGQGFHFCVPADTTPRRIRVYAGVGTGNIRVSAKLSDFSAPEFTSLNDAGPDRVYEFRYRASRANQMLYVTVGAVGNEQGRLFAVTSNLSAPVSNDSAVTLQEDTPATFTLNFTDPDGGPNPNQVTVTIPTANGTVTGPLNGTLTYTPNPNFNGTDRLTYVVSDGLFTSAGATVTFTVTPVNDGPPLLVNDTATTPDNVAVTTAVLANDTIIDTPFTVSLVGQPANGTAVLNPDNTITYRGNLSFIGTDVLTYRVIDGDGESSTATLTITVTAIPPAITSPLNVNAIQGLLFTYKITATGSLPMTFTAAPLPAGVTLVGDTLQGFIQAGSYAVTLSATNSTASDIRTLVINAIVQSPNVDTDGDGFTDEFEIGVGSSPVDPNSTPFTVLRNGAGGIPGGIPTPGTVANPKPFFVGGLGIKLDFKSAKVSRDAIAFKGTLPVPRSFTSALQAVAANVGGVTVSGVLDSRGSYTSANKLVKIKVGKTRTSLAGANAPISVSAKGIYAGALTDEGYVNSNSTKVFGKVVLFVAASNEYFSATVNTEYNARTGQKGSVKAAKR